MTDSKALCFVIGVLFYSEDMIGVDVVDNEGISRHPTMCLIMMLWGDGAFHRWSGVFTHWHHQRQLIRDQISYDLPRVNFSFWECFDMTIHPACLEFWMITFLVHFLWRILNVLLKNSSLGLKTAYQGTCNSANKGSSWKTNTKYAESRLKG